MIESRGGAPLFALTGLAQISATLSSPSQRSSLPPCAVFSANILGTNAEETGASSFLCPHSRLEKDVGGKDRPREGDGKEARR